MDLTEPDSAERALVASVSTRLDKLSAAAMDILRAAAVLGMRFTTTELAATVARLPSELLDVFEEVVRVKMLVYVGNSLAFSHSAQRRALCDSMPLEVLATLHRSAARVLADAGAPVVRVCEQLAAMSDGQLEPWVIDWLVAHDVELAACAPLPMLWVLNRALETCPSTHPHRAVLLDRRARFLRQVGTRGSTVQHPAARAALRH